MFVGAIPLSIISANPMLVGAIVMLVSATS
jgi:hypothetical protein